MKCQVYFLYVFELRLYFFEGLYISEKDTQKINRAKNVFVLAKNKGVVAHAAFGAAVKNATFASQWDVASTPEDLQRLSVALKGTNHVNILLSRRNASALRP